ncbi:cytokinesis-related protein [Haematococcus lacustris]
MFSLGRNAKTFRPKKNTPVGSKGLQLKRHIEATLGSGNIMAAVQLPPGEDLQEWLAVNTVDFYNAVSVLYATLGEFCTDRTCEVMSASSKYEYLWADGVKVRKPIRLSAPEYIDKLFDWIEAQIDDETVFPQQFGMPFPPNFLDVTKTIYKRLFRVYAHMYHSHFKQICSLDEEAHLNTCFKHFIFFTLHYRLVDEKELAPLQELIDQFTGKARAAAAAAAGGYR